VSEQTDNIHRVGRIVDYHLIESEAANTFCQCSGHWGNRVAAFAFAGISQPGMDFLHKGMKVRSALLWNCQRIMEQVHQHGFAAANTAPHVNALGARLFASEQLAQQSAGLLCLEFFLQMVEPFGCAALVWIRAKLPVSYQPFISGEYAGQM